MTIDLNLEVSHSQTKQTINICDYGMTRECWCAMSETEQEEWLYDNVIDEFDSPVWVIDSFKED